MDLRYYRKTPIAGAFQMTQERRYDNIDCPQWMNRAWQEPREIPGSIYPTVEGSKYGTISIGTPTGSQIVYWDDWIIKENTGELHVCSPSYFDETYEPIEI